MPRLVLAALCLLHVAYVAGHTDVGLDDSPPLSQPLHPGVRTLVGGVGSKPKHGSVDADESERVRRQRSSGSGATTTAARSAVDRITHSGSEAGVREKTLGEAGVLQETPEEPAALPKNNTADTVDGGAVDAPAGAASPVRATFIPLHPTLPQLTVKDLFTLKGRLKLDSASTRQLHINSWADVSASPNGAGVFGGNMHVASQNEVNEFRYSNSHNDMGAIGFAANFPHYNKASIVSSQTKSSEKDQVFTPEALVTFTGNGNVGIGVTGPASRLHVQSKGNERQINANHWLDASGCSSGVGLVAGNSYVSTVGDKAQFRYANSHSSIGAVGLAFNYPAWNQASIISSPEQHSEAKKEFKPLVIQTFTNDGKVGIGTDKPAARLDIRSPNRQLSVNNWVELSAQEHAGFMGTNAYLSAKDSFSFSNTDGAVGAIGIATNFPENNVLSIVASKETSSTQGTKFKPEIVATYTKSGLGLGTSSPGARLDIQHHTGRQLSTNQFADISANEKSQGFFGGNGYTAGTEFSFSNTHATFGAIGFATHYPDANSASIIHSGAGGSTAGSSFSPQVITQFTSDGSIKVHKDIVVTGDIRIGGRMIYTSESGSETKDDPEQYDMLAAHEALLEENSKLKERMQTMEEAMMSMQTTLEQR